MAPQHALRLAGRADWTLMTAIHDALRRDLDQLLHTTASHASARARWTTFRGQLRFHLAAEHAAMWPRVQARLAGDPHGQALLDAMDDEHQLLGPLQTVIDDAFTVPADPGRLRQLLTRLRTRLASHLAHEEADALPLISQILSPGELGRIAAAIRGGPSTGHAGTTIPWALADARPDVREHVLSQLPAPARLLYRTVWLPRYTRTAPQL
jgi:iron-sulfur cluster repair protein YtfE (RIC family)